MKVEVKKDQDVKCTMEVVIESEKVDQSYDRHLREAARNVAIPGFRKGKAPMRYAERYLNKALIMQQVLEELGPYAIQDAMTQEALTPLNEPSMEIVQFEKGKDLILKTSFEVKPEVQVDEYTGWEITQEKAEVLDDDIENTIKMMQDKAAQYADIEEDRGLEKGDFALVDFESFHEGQSVEKGSEKNYMMELKDDAFIPGFIDNLIGLKKGEHKDFQVTFPPEYPTELKGKPVDFKFNVISIKKKVLPELNDDFAKEVSKFGKMDELRAHVKEEFSKRIENQATAGVEEKIKEKLAAKITVTLPDTLISYEQGVIVDGMRRNVEAQGIPFEEYLKRQGINIAALVASVKPQAERLGKIEMALDAVAKKESLTIDDSEIEAKISEIAEQLRQDPAKLKEMLQKEGRVASLKYEMLKQKTLDFLVKSSKVTYVPPGSLKEEKVDSKQDHEAEASGEEKADSKQGHEAEASGEEKESETSKKES